ncbi:alpha actinin [Echinococcus multilocularis]|uniref:Alpha actinin n=1 Tax=Echinococcus multilocularis TaxID=6211 RepID=A0A087W1G2_ECHMU|nr:alpha actinin [Echinococcus multilocularis]
MSKKTLPSTASNPFKQADKAANPAGAKPKKMLRRSVSSSANSYTPSYRPATRSHTFLASKQPGATSAKEIMLHWCQVMTKGYPHVEVKNFGSSWADGMAFCALIHHFYPDAFDFSTLKPENRRANFELAFKTAEELGNVAPLLEMEDLLRTKVPDWKCIFTQIQLYYRRFQLEQGANANKPPVGLHPSAPPPNPEGSST